MGLGVLSGNPITSPELGDLSEDYRTTVLVLVRHGQARVGDDLSLGPKTPLSRLGLRQAALVASELARRSPHTAVYVSPLPRAVESAAPICERLGLEAVVDPRLTEFDLGPATVESVEERPDLLVWRPEHTGADGETLGQFSARVAAFCEEVVDRHLGERVVVVSHAGTMDAVLRWSMGIAATSPWVHDFKIANASITEIELWPRGRVLGGAPRHAILKRVGDVAHLNGLVTDI